MIFNVWVCQSILHMKQIPNIRKSDFDGKTHCNTFGYPDHAHHLYTTWREIGESGRVWFDWWNHHQTALIVTTHRRSSIFGENYLLTPVTTNEPGRMFRPITLIEGLKLMNIHESYNHKYCQGGSSFIWAIPRLLTLHFPASFHSSRAVD